MLQIADTLINGSGLCRRLGEPSGDGRAGIVRLIEGIVCDDGKDSTLGQFTAAEHKGNCHTACYRCIQQYGNRRVHNLLDWRLAVGYLRAMVDPGYAGGLDGRFDQFPELDGWLDRSWELATSVAAMRPETLRVEPVGPMKLASIVQGSGASVLRMTVVHPFWATNDPAVRAILHSGEKGEFRFVDTFDLERRPLKALEMAKAAQAGADH